MSDGSQEHVTGNVPGGGGSLREGEKQGHNSHAGFHEPECSAGISKAQEKCWTSRNGGR